jgi:hypothetical protein
LARAAAERALVERDNENVGNNDADEADNNAAEVEGVAGEADAGNANANQSYWTLFFKLTPADGDKIAHYSCLLPPETVSASKQLHQPDIKKSGGTGSLHRHLKSTFHVKAMKRFSDLIGAPHFMEAGKAVQQVIQEASSRMQANSIATLMSNAKRARGDGDALAAQLVRELAFVAFQIDKGLSFNTVESRYLKLFMMQAEQQQLPSRKRIADTILPLMYSLVTHERAQKWRDIDFFAMTVDAWTSIAKDRYLSITIHTITSTFELSCALLDLVSLPEAHTWQNMTRAVAVRLRNLLPPTATLVCTVTDNAYVRCFKTARFYIRVGRTKRSWLARCTPT